jgi:hypothetical protein
VPAINGYRRAVVIDAGSKNTKKTDALRGERRCALKNDLTEPTLLEMSGYRISIRLGMRR